MREFFRGWRRKTGLALLAMAMLLTGAWIRSLVLQDQILTQHKRSLLNVKSFDGRIWWGRHTPTPFEMTYEWMSNPFPKSERIDPWENYDLHWCWKWGGFNFGAGKGNSAMGGRETEIWIVPHWSIVLPLTLLSAWLILSKPRPAKSARESDHA